MHPAPSSALPYGKAGVWALIGSVGAAAVGVLVFATTVLDATLIPDWRVFLPLLIFGGFAVATRVREAGENIGLSLVLVILLVSAVLAGPVGAAMIGFLSYFCDFPPDGDKRLLFPKKTKRRSWLFNAVSCAFLGAVGGVTYLLAVALMGSFGVDLQGGPEGLSTPGFLRQVPASELWLAVGIPVLITHLVIVVVNIATVSVMFVVAKNEPYWKSFRKVVTGEWWNLFTQGPAGFLFVILWGPGGLYFFSLIPALVPLGASQWAVWRETKARRRHDESVSAFVSALEQTDPSTAGHSERVTGLVIRMAEAMKLEPAELRDLKYAATLHDLGMLTVKVERAGDLAHDEEFLSAISSHPEAGVQFLDGLDFLKGAKHGIFHHHERWDGRGYPIGIAGEDIPLYARMIAVAETYDVLTSDRARPAQNLSKSEALDVLQERAGTHLDPTLVGVLAGVVAKDPENADPGTPTVNEGATGGWMLSLGHDEPEVSDAYANWQPDLDPTEVPT